MTQKNKDYIWVCEPDISDKEIALVTEAIKSGHISSTARYTKDFEKQFAEKFDVKYAVATNSGGSALFLTLWAMGIREGDEVIVPTFTMIATANAVVQCGAKPVFVDCEENGNIDVSKLEEKITNKTKAIIPVHIYGHPCDMDEIMDIAKRNNLLVIEDAAEAHGAIYKGRKVGSIGDASCFSFYANKLITTGEGGMIATNNADVADELSRLRAYHFSDEMHFWHKRLAWNLRLGSLQAALGIAQLSRLDELVEKRRNNRDYYNKRLHDLRHELELPYEKDGVRSVYWMYGIVLKRPGLRDKLMDFLEENGVETRTYFFPMHWQPIHEDKNSEYPVADRLGKNGLYLPSSSHLTQEQKDRVISLVVDFYKSN